MLILGITGSIAMGKTTVAQMFADKGIPTTNADAIVHELLASDATTIAEIKAAFPSAIENGAVNRRLLGQQVFCNDVAVQQLEHILHPKVRATEIAFILREQKKGAWLVVLDIPLLFETGADARVDKVLVVTANPSMQRERVMARPNMTVEKFQQILARQMPDAEKRRRADFLVETDNGLERTRVKVHSIFDELKELAGK